MAIERSFVVPFRSRLKESGFPQILLKRFKIDFKTQPGAVWYRYKTSIYNRLVRFVRPSDAVKERCIISLVIFQSQELVTG